MWQCCRTRSDLQAQSVGCVGMQVGVDLVCLHALRGVLLAPLELSMSGDGPFIAPHPALAWLQGATDIPMCLWRTTLRKVGPSFVLERGLISCALIFIVTWCAYHDCDHICITPMVDLLFTRWFMRCKDVIVSHVWVDVYVTSLLYACSDQTSVLGLVHISWSNLLVSFEKW
jgi:hypothetical protein